MSELSGYAVPVVDGGDVVGVAYVYATWAVAAVTANWQQFAALSFWLGEDRDGAEFDELIARLDAMSAAQNEDMDGLLCRLRESRLASGVLQ